MTILETPRLYLRQFTLTDAPLILQLNSDQEVLKYLHEPQLQTIAEAEQVLTNIILPQYALNLGRWAVHLKHDDQFIGWCGLKSRPELQETDLGYRFKKQFWGKGYATEAAIHVLQYGLESLHIERITGRAHIDNIASLKILGRIGMKYLRDEIIDDCPVKTFVATRKNA